MSTAKNVSQPAGSDVQESAVIRELQTIALEHDGFLNPDDVVTRARDPKSPLHDQFTWDDEAAAEDWRRAQACALIRRVKLHIVREVTVSKAVTLSVEKSEAEPQPSVTVQPVRRYQSRPSARGGEGGYESTLNIMQDPDKRAEMVAAALSELRAVQRRYATLNELSKVWEALDAL